MRKLRITKKARQFRKQDLLVEQEQEKNKI